MSAVQVYSTRFLVAEDIETHSGFGPAPGVVWVLRDVSFYNGNAFSTGVDVRIGDINTGARLISHLFADASDYYYLWQGRIVITYPDEIGLQTSSLVGTSGIDLYIGGYTLNGP